MPTTPCLYTSPFIEKFGTKQRSLPAGKAHSQVLSTSWQSRRCWRCMCVVRASEQTGVEKLSDLRPALESAIKAGIGNCLTEATLDFGNCVQGKVRNTYDLGDKLVIITTDRQSAFDRVIGAIPFKGQVLNQTSAWWMEQTSHMVPNALLAVPDPNAAIMLKCSVIPVEFVVRGFLTGSTETSLWTLYAKGEREFGGATLGNAMRKNDRLKENMITPTTKAADHDIPIHPKDIVAQELMTQKEWDQVSQMALALFSYGQAQAAKRGLILVDTKYEFGRSADGRILLIDEVHTPDSSRYWIAETYESRHRQGLDPQNIDKEFLRLWFRAHCDPYADKVLPEAPHELVTELSRRYIILYEKITGQQFYPAQGSTDIGRRIAQNVKSALKTL